MTNISLSEFVKFYLRREESLFKISNYTLAGEELEKRRKEIKGNVYKCITFDCIACQVRMEASALSNFLHGKRKKIMPLDDYCWLIVFFANSIEDVMYLLFLGGYLQASKLKNEKIRHNISEFFISMEDILQKEKQMEIRTEKQALNRFNARYENLKDKYHDNMIQFLSKNF